MSGSVARVFDPVGGGDDGRVLAIEGVTVQSVIYGGRVVACATARRFFLCDGLDRRPVCDPERRFVIFMCCYAGDVLRGELPGPYSDEDARRYARAALIPEELLERPSLDVARAATALGVPFLELSQARAEAGWRG